MSEKRCAMRALFGLKGSMPGRLADGVGRCRVLLTLALRTVAIRVVRIADGFLVPGLTRSSSR